MPNYRGGDNTISPQMAEALRAIKSGTAGYQRRRDLMNKGIVHGTQAALMGVGGLAKAMYQSEKDHDAQVEELNKNQAAAYKQQIGIDDFQARLNNAKQEVMASAINNAKASKERLRGVKDSIDVADAGVASPYGDVWNRRAFDEAHDEASLLANDIGVAKSIIKGSSDWDAGGAAVGGPVPTGQEVLPALRGRRGLGGSLQTWGQ